MLGSPSHSLAATQQQVDISFNLGKKYWGNILKSVLDKAKKQSIAINGLSYAGTWMKGQFVYCLDNQSSSTYEVTITYDKRETENCHLGLGKINETQAQFTVGPKSRSSPGTMDKYELTGTTSIGGMTFKHRVI